MDDVRVRVRGGAEALLSPEGTKAGRLQRIALDAIRRHRLDGTIPTSIRFLFYELEQEGHLSKRIGNGRGRTDSQNLSDAVLRLRQVGLVPWSWIVDETRSLSTWRYADTVAGYLVDSAETARIGVWDGDRPPMILTESRSLSGVLTIIAYAYLCPIAATNGQVGGFLHTDVIPALEAGQRVLYLGDADLSGNQIEANTRREIERETGELRWKRIAITNRQVAGLRRRGVPPIVKNDRRYAGGRRHEAFETEALGQRPIQDLLRARLEALLPEPLEDVRVREQAERDRAVKRLRRWK